MTLDNQVVEILQSRLRAIKANIQSALERSNVDRPETGKRSVTIIGVTKTVAPETVRAAYAAGLTDCGENRAQEGSIKLESLQDLPLRWHMIGYLQRNKAKSVVGRYALIHSLDRVDLAQELDRRAQKAGVCQDCLVQVNVAREPNKAGIDPEDLISLLRTVSRMDGIRIRGLMTIAPLVDDPEEVRPVFRRMRQLFDHLQELAIDGVEMEHLSMGMTGDYEVAVEEGATMVRIGRALFGPRPA